jgi:hypothetical protein
MVNKNTDSEDKIKTNKDSSIKLSLKPNTNQFLLVIVMNAFVGAMIGLNKKLLILDKEEKDAINNSNQYSEKYNKFYLHNMIIIIYNLTFNYL